MIPATGMPQVVALHDLNEARALMRHMGVSEGGVDIMDKKGLFRVLRLTGLDTRAASILKQHGFREVHNVAGGMTGYSAAGYARQCDVCENPHGSRFFSVTLGPSALRSWQRSRR